jgi:molybdate transport system substrate-binding protein
MWKARSAAVVVVTAALALTGCSSSGSGAKAGASSPPKVTLTVLAASSLTKIMPILGGEFSKANPGVTMKFEYGGSATLATQITEGAPVDVFASAAPAPMQTVVAAGDADGTPTVFVRNQLVIAVRPGNPHNITGLQDLTKPGLKVILCEATQPCGSAAVTALAAAKITTLKPASLAPDVKSALSPVESGEADAALVYTTDAEAAGSMVTAVPFPESAKAINLYPIAALTHSKNLTQAREFVAFVESPAALQQFESEGFLAPQ